MLAVLSWMVKQPTLHTSLLTERTGKKLGYGTKFLKSGNV